MVVEGKSPDTIPATSKCDASKGLRIGIVTILKTNNYGAELQAFALQEKLTGLGFEAEIIDYLFYKNREFISTKKSKPFVNIGFKKKFKEFLNPYVEGLKSFPHRVGKKAREARFLDFHKTHTRFSTQTFHSIDELYKSELVYDIFLVGSDQVWNPYSYVNLEPYFLTFAPAEKRKISYASSFGVSSLPSEAHATYRECLNNLDQISVREAEGVKLVKELTDRDATHVLDPTLLLERQVWGKVAINPNSIKPYLLLYVLTDSPYATKLAKRVADDLGLDLVRICKDATRQDKDDSIQNIIDAGPAEFVGLFLNASFVLTNSFHGTAFSVNFGKPFYTVLPKHKPNNSRQEGLLSSLKLEDRLVKEGDVFPEKKRHSLDFTESSRLMDERRRQSIDWLVKAIGGGSHD